jgi:hypothetical protein
MSKFRLQFSLRTLLIAFTVVAVVIAFVASHLGIVIGGLVAALWLLEFISGPLGNFVEAWPELKGPRLVKPPRSPEKSKRTVVESDK